MVASRFSEVFSSNSSLSPPSSTTIHSESPVRGLTRRWNARVLGQAVVALISRTEKTLASRPCEVGGRRKLMEEVDIAAQEPAS